MDTLKDDVLCKEKLYVDESSVAQDSLENDLEVFKELKFLRDSNDAVGFAFDAAWEVLDRHLKEKSPKLGAAATREEALEAINELISAYGPGLVLVRNTVYAKIQKLMKLFIRARRYRSRPTPAGGPSGSDLYKWGTIEKDLPLNVLNHYRKAKSDHIGLLQTRIWSLLENQTTEVKEWWYLHNNEFTEHLNITKERPEFLESGANEILSANIYSSKPIFPLEISTIIMSYCSLETCVSLRQVSRVWYHAFQLTDLESSVKQRCPWFRLEGELHSWSECALVFVQRQNSGKWSSADSFEDNIPLRPLDENTPYRVEPIELELGEKLPADFEPINTHLPGDDCVCDSVHFKQRFSPEYEMHEISETYPVANYKGLIWWHMVGKGLVPTSVDLDMQERFKFQYDRTIPYTKYCHITQCSNRRFVVCNREDVEVVLFDLESATATVMGLEGNVPEEGVIKGFVKGRFAPRYLSASTFEEYRRMYEVGYEDDED
ncbi:hypothetical protein CJU90_3217 [Yarrowia sp. C11]|nr:hypothetical protein CJU90_3217 [Yarrowia sp. C11]